MTDFRLRRLWTAARANEPVAYILGEWGFAELTLNVDRGC